MSRRPSVLRSSAVIACMLLAAPRGASAEDDKSPPAAPSPGAPVADAEKVHLRVSLPKRAAFDLVTAATSSRTMKFQSTKVKFTDDVVARHRLQVTDVAETGAATVSQTLVRVHGSVTTPIAGKAQFDSDRPTDFPTGAELGRSVAGYVAAVGLEASAEVQPDGTMGAAGQPRPEAIAIEAAFSPAGGFPSRAIGRGDTWTTEFDVTVRAIRLRSSAKVAVAEIAPDSVTFTFDGTLTKPAPRREAPAANSDGVRPDQLTEFAGKMRLVSGTAKGTFTVSRKDGCVLRSEMTADAELALDPDPGQANPLVAGGMTLTVHETIKATREPAPPPKPAETPVPEKVPAGPAVPAVPAASDPK